MSAPLAGVRAVTIAVNVPGPAAAARLVGLGATVTKVEPPGGDPLASLHPRWYEELAAGQEIVTLDLKQAAGRERLDALLEEADLLLTSNRRAALERLGLAPEALRRRFPTLVHVAIVGHPAPGHDRPGHDLTYAAEHGLVAPPGLPPTLVADLGGAELAVTAALALLLARERGAGGGFAEVPLAGAAERFAAPLRHGATAAGGTLGGGLPRYGLYETRSGWIAVAALEPRFQERLRAELGLDELTRPALERRFTERDAEEWEAWARPRDLPLVAVRPTATGPRP